MSESRYIDIAGTAKLMGHSHRHIKRLINKGALQAEKKNGRWMVDVTSNPKLARLIADARIESIEELRCLPARKREEALRKVGIIKDFEKFAARLWRAGEKSETKAISLYAASRNDVTGRSLIRWLAKYKSQGLLGLVDMRGGDINIQQIISPGALDYFKSMYLTQQQLSVKLCWQNISFINKDESRGWCIPALQSMYRLKEQIPLPVRVLLREGRHAYDAKCAPYIQIDPDSVEPGEVWVGDHSQFNCWIRHRGRWIRPWLTAWEDMRSRMIVGWYISASPNQITILRAARRALERYGPPDSVKIDNGKDFDSECWTGTTKIKRRILRKGYIDEPMVAGLYAWLGIGISFSIKYHPQSKPIERFFDTLDCQLTKTIPTYCGKDTQRRPENLQAMLKSEKAMAEAYDLVSFAESVSQYVNIYNNSVHTGAGMEDRSPAQVLAGRQSRRVLVDGVLQLLLKVWSGELKVGKNGVRFNKMWYGQYNKVLAARQGKKVRVAYDPDDLRQVHVYDAATLKLITVAEQNRLIGYGQAVNEEALRDAMAQKNQALKTARAYRNSRLTANMDLTDLTLRAMADAAEKPAAAQQPRTLRPVMTPLDGQVAEHKRQVAVKAVKKAAGAEGTEVVLDIDFSAMKGKRGKVIDLGLFKDD